MRQGEHLLEAVVSKAKENRLEAEMQQSNMQEKLSEAERQSRVAREDLAQFQKNAEAEAVTDGKGRSCTVTRERHRRRQ